MLILGNSPTYTMDLSNIAGIGSDSQKIDELTDEEVNNLETKDDVEKGDESSADSQPEKKEEETLPSQEGEEEVKGKASEDTPDEVKEEPLHKNPRFTQVIRERNELRETVSNFKERFEKLEEAQVQPKQDESIPNWFKDQIGDDDTLWQQYQKRLEDERDVIADRVVKKQEASSKIEINEKDSAKQFCDNSIQDLKDLGHKFDDKEFRQFMYENPVTNIEKNELDFEKGLKLFNQVNAKPQEDKTARKKIASQTTPTSKGESKSDGPMTPSQLRNRSWSSLAGL